MIGLLERAIKRTLAGQNTLMPSVAISHSQSPGNENAGMSANPTQPTGLRVFLMGTGGYASIILHELLERGEEVVGVCCSRKTAAPGPRARMVRTSRRIGRLVLDNVGLYTPRGFAFQSPFDGVESPAEFRAFTRA